MKTIFTCCYGLLLTGLLQAQVGVFPPDFVLFGKTSRDYCAEYTQFALTVSTNEDYFFPEVGQSSSEGVYFLHRPVFFGTNLGIQTYIVPDDVYLYVAIIFQNWDNVDVGTPFTLEQLRKILNDTLDRIIDVRAAIDGVALTNLWSYRTESPFFSVYFPTTDNIYSVILGEPFQGLDDPVVAGGYLIMLKPVPAGLHDVRTLFTFGPPDGFTRERHYQINSLPVPQFLAHKAAQLDTMVASSPLAPNRQQPLLASLDAAQTSLAANRMEPAINQLKAFQHKVGVQLRNGDQDITTEWIETAQKIIDRATAYLK